MRSLTCSEKFGEASRKVKAKHQSILSETISCFEGMTTVDSSVQDSSSSPMFRIKRARATLNTARALV